MSSLFSEFGTDPKNEQQGVEFTYTDGYGHEMFQVRLARVGGSNKKYEQEMERLMQPHRRTKKIQDEVREAIVRKAFSKTCALPGTWKFKETDGMQAEGNICKLDEATKELVWSPEVPKCRQPDGWVKGIQNKNGEVVKDTADSISEVLEQLPELFLMLFREASSHEAFRAEDLADDSKN